MLRIETCSAQASSSATVFLHEVGISRPLSQKQIAEMACIIHASIKCLNVRFVMELLLVKYGFVFTENVCVSVVAYSKGVDNSFSC
jgi:hypothetical protein